MTDCDKHPSGTGHKQRRFLVSALWLAALLCLACPLPAQTPLPAADPFQGDPPLEATNVPESFSTFETPPIELNPFEQALRPVGVETGRHSLSLTHSPWQPNVFQPSSRTDSGWEILPPGLLYRAYLAGVKEPRFSAVWLTERKRGLIWETTLGGRVGIFRVGNPNAPDGATQFDLEGAAFARVDPEENSDLEAVDFRVGLFVTRRTGPWATKIGYYHVSSHIGDEFLLRNPGFPRKNYVRDSFLSGISYDMTPDIRLYGELGYALSYEGGALPLEFQFGAEYSPMLTPELRGAPYAAINGHVREDFGYSGSINIHAGWQWKGRNTKRRFRIGVQYYSGPSLQYSFTNLHEELLGGGIWLEY